MAENNQNNIAKTEEISDFNIKDFIKICLNKWWWFAICLCCAIGIALFYIYRKQPEYIRYEQVLVNEQDSGGGVADISNAFSTLGLFSKNTNVYNELLTITSPAILYQVADSLQLYMNYAIRDGLRYKTLYGSNLPFRVDMLDIDSQRGGSFRMELEPDGSMELKRFTTFIGNEKVKFKDVINVKPGQEIVQTPLGLVKITPNPNYESDESPKKKTIVISKMPMQTTVELYSKKFKADLADQDADVIEMTVTDVSVQRAMDILNYVLKVYNQDWVNDKNRMARATSAFIDERLKVIQEELGDVDESLAQFVKKTGIPNVVSDIATNYEINARLKGEILTISNQLTMSKYMQDFLKKNKNLNTVLPVNLGIDDYALGNQIVAYNELLLNRNSILSSSSDSNPLVQSYDQQLSEMRKGIEQSVNNRVETLQEAFNNLQGEQSKTNNQLANTPEATLPMLSEERQKAVKEALYLFLLQKKEENELTMKFTADNVRVITPPIGPLNPIAPRKGLIIIIAGIIGLGSPLILLYFLETSNTTVRSKKDLDNIIMPFTGEIPQVGKKQNLKELAQKLPTRKKKDEKPPLAVVEEGKRDVVNEAFRVIRGNIDFMTGKNAGPQVIMLTSFNPGSGKSFITYNLAMSFCIKGKKVLIIDCDLRHGSSSMYVGMPHKGLTSFLTGNTDDWKSLIVQSPASPNLSIMPIGKIPPNPAELLEDGRLETLVEEARKDYDVIFLDCPPVNIVVDTQIVAPLADRTLFVVRAGLLERSALKELNEFYEEKKFKNMSVILNGTEAVHSRYYTYGNYQNLN
ncbi:MAG: polysaccharide biosynthesis tyrosine autokinase [Muribaculaceae bacterium]|nr:polysaccharide biosynthesis tyrosine autokinase [Muribaculaceae bacterium]